jgi:hypothetical protein
LIDLPRPDSPNSIAKVRLQKYCDMLQSEMFVLKQRMQEQTGQPQGLQAKHDVLLSTRSCTERALDIDASLEDMSHR